MDEILDILVTRVPKSLELGNGWGMSPINCDLPARKLIRYVKSRRFVCDKLEEEFRFGAFVHRYHSRWLIEIEIADKRSVRNVVRQVKRIIKTHKDSRYPTAAERKEKSGLGSGI